MPRTQLSTYVVPARLVLTAEGAARVRRLITRPPEPTEDMMRLFEERHASVQDLTPRSPRPTS